MTDVSAMDTLTQLHDLHERLVRAQRAETNAIRKLGEFTASGKRQSEGFQALLDAVHRARRHTVEIYEEWNRVVHTLHTEATTSPAPDPSVERQGSPPS